MLGGALDGDVFLGKKVEEHRGVFRLTYPMEHGVVKNWADMEEVWNRTKKWYVLAYRCSTNLI